MQFVSDPKFQSDLRELEAERKIISGLKLKAYLFIALGALFILLLFIIGTFPIFWIILAVAGIITGIVCFSKSGNAFSNYRHAFKQKIISAALKSIDEGMELDYENGLSENDFIFSQLFTQKPDRYTSQDQIFGTAGKTKFSFSEVHAEYKTETRTKNGTQEHWHTILKGIVFCADFNKYFNGITLVRPKDFGSAIGAWISSNIPIFSSSDRELIKLENPDFEKTFVTYSSDQVEARYILTPALMERLCQLNSRSKYTISLSFIETRLYIAFPLDKDYFEPPVFRSLLDLRSVNEDAELIKFMYDIIQELDLNTRIWGKQ